DRPYREAGHGVRRSAPSACRRSAPSPFWGEGTDTGVPRAAKNRGGGACPDLKIKTRRVGECAHSDCPHGTPVNAHLPTLYEVRSQRRHKMLVCSTWAKAR